MANKDNNKDFIYFHVRVDREHYDLYKKLCKDNGDTVAVNMRRYIYAICNQYEDNLINKDGEHNDK